MKSARRRCGDLELATYTYEHPGTGRWFRLIGTAHMAEPGFWLGLKRSIAEAVARGCEVHYEMVRGDGNKPKPVEGSPLQRFATALYLESQDTGLVLEDGWHNTDMTVAEVIAAAPDPVKAEAFLDKMDGAQVNAAESITDATRPMLRWFIRYLLPIVDKLHYRDRVILKFLLNGRSDYAMGKMLARDADIVTIWGAGHLPRMGKILRRNGYRLTDTTWSTVVARVPTVEVEVPDLTV